jgi:hypothetical protein
MTKGYMQSCDFMWHTYAKEDLPTHKMVQPPAVEEEEEVLPRVPERDKGVFDDASRAALEERKQVEQDSRPAKMGRQGSV